jgi:hypothetical protein
VGLKRFVDSLWSKSNLVSADRAAPLPASPRDLTYSLTTFHPTEQDGRLRGERQGRQRMFPQGPEQLHAGAASGRQVVRPALRGPCGGRLGARSHPEAPPVHSALRGVLLRPDRHPHGAHWRLGDQPPPEIRVHHAPQVGGGMDVFVVTNGSKRGFQHELVENARGHCSEQDLMIILDHVVRVLVFQLTRLLVQNFSEVRSMRPTPISFTTIWQQFLPSVDQSRCTKQ